MEGKVRTERIESLHHGGAPDGTDVRIAVIGGGASGVVTADLSEDEKRQLSERTNYTEGDEFAGDPQMVQAIETLRKKLR